MEKTDLGALVITLRATRSLTIHQYMGRAARQLCLDLVHDVDPALSAALHAPRQIKPYSVSGLLLPESVRPVEGAVRPGDNAWVRLVGLQAEVVAALDHFAQQAPSTVTFDRVPWEIARATWTDHPWAGRATYAGLIQQHHAAAPPDVVWFEFVSPTAFSSADLNIPLPDPLRVSDSLRQQWNALNPLPAALALPDTFMDFVQYFVPLTEYRAHSEAVRLETPEIGFCAEHVKFTIKPHARVSHRLRIKNPDRARVLDALNDQRDDLARAVALLSDFAFYGGVGIKTTTGMGMAQRI
jgi:CRISPR-associated endoribonuclease Cas6